jgi:hypothetical protein
MGLLVRQELEGEESLEQDREEDRIHPNLVDEYEYLLTVTSVDARELTRFVSYFLNAASEDAKRQWEMILREESLGDRQDEEANSAE